MSAQPRTPPAFNFDFNEALAPWNTPAKQWISKHNKTWDGLASANLVFNKDKILLIQRSSHDSMPNKWEVPGGAVDDDDASILYGAARELWEEAGLLAKSYKCVVFEQPGQQPGQIFPNRAKTKVWCRFSFVVEVENAEEVTLDPAEHQDYVWVTEDEVMLQGTQGQELPITTDGMKLVILEAFRLRAQDIASA